MPRGGAPTRRALRPRTPGVLRSNYPEQKAKTGFIERGIRIAPSPPPSGIPETCGANLGFKGGGGAAAGSGRRTGQPDNHQPTNTKERDTMKRLMATIMSVAVFAALSPVADAQTACPPEVSKAKTML